jgi:outer membrane protein assembly factor BamB
MRKRIQALLIIALSITTAVFLSACGGDGTGGRIIGGGSPGDGGILPGDEGTLQWLIGLGEINSCPAIGTIYVASPNGFVYAVNHDGTLQWSFETGGAIEGAPAVGSDGTIYVGSFDRQFYAINPNGTLQCVYPTKSRLTTSPAIASDGTIYIGGIHADRYIYLCPDDTTRIEQVGHLYAINPDCTLKWNYVVSGEVHSSPAIAPDGTIYIASYGDNEDLSFDRVDQCDKNSVIPPSDTCSIYQCYPVNGFLYAINPNGTLKWDFKTIGDVDSSPAIGSDGTIYIGSDYAKFAYGLDDRSFIGVGSVATGFMYAINPNGTIKWLFDALGDVDSSPAVGEDGTIYFGSDKNDVFALNPDGTLKWLYPTKDDVDSSPAIASDGTIYIGSDDNNLYAFNPNGTVKWLYKTGGDVDSSPTIWTNGTIYVGSDDTNLYAINGFGSLANTPWPKFSHDLQNTGRSN